MILTILGARPQFIKAAALSKALLEIGIEERIIHTGQHFDYNMSQVFFDELGIPTVVENLHIGAGEHGRQTGEMLIALEALMLQYRSSIKAVLVYGDTNSTLAGALCAAKLQLPVVHVEAGLRSWNKSMPEEINRIMTDHVSDLLFCSSEIGVKNLREEGILENVHISGDIMQDSMRIFRDSSRSAPFAEQLSEINHFNLLTIHRPSNTDDVTRLQEILSALGETDEVFIWPVHPRNKKSLKTLVIPDQIKPIAPFSYFEMLDALEHCNRVITDSGGLQKEAYWSRKPCITIRTETEWTETLHDQWNQLCPDLSQFSSCWEKEPTKLSWIPLYGDGHAGEFIASKIKEIF